MEVAMSRETGRSRSIADLLLVSGVFGVMAGAALPACSSDDVVDPPPGSPEAGVTTGTGGKAGNTGSGGGAGGTGGSPTTGSGGTTTGGAGTPGSGGSSGAGGSGGSGGATGGAGGSNADGGVSDASTIPPPWPTGIKIPPSTQKPGDPKAGYQYLTNAGYFGCGMPQRFYSIVGPAATLPGSGNEPLPGRDVVVDGKPLPYMWNKAKNADNIDVLYMNCLQCHAGKFNGQLVVGLGNADSDWTNNLGAAADVRGLLLALLPSPQEWKEIDRFMGRMKVVGPAAVMRTVGTNPAEMLATTFISHRDKKTLAWSDTPFLTIPVIDRLPAGDAITSKVPPWWRMSKKNGQFYNGMGRGDHRRSMMLAGSLCTDSVAEAEAIDVHFNDVNAYISTLPPPKYPFPIDRALADKGHAVFLNTCATCHGTYAPDPVTYPNILISQATVGTDDVVGLAGTTPDYGSELVAWYNDSWYGQVGPYQPMNAYMPPPLDAVWATAPYLHNGSVPDMDTLLDSTKRPKYWRRLDHDTTHFDQKTLGFTWEPLASGQRLPPFGIAAKDIYDTEQYSHSNKGHTFGDPLTAEERRAVIEYLKTL
jgi:mono/diheme cytochrome c family protein